MGSADITTDTERSVDDLRVTMPISIRRPDDPVGGNRITLMRFVVPVSDPDPASRVRAIGALCRAARNERSLTVHRTRSPGHST